ncbi:hypothetical protein ACVI1J_001744 [Bradyrhizobium diazoefficiens]
MCEKCTEIDEKIVRFKRIIDRFTDRQTVDGLTEAIAELQAEKAKLHREAKE